MQWKSNFVHVNKARNNIYSSCSWLALGFYLCIVFKCSIYRDGTNGICLVDHVCVIKILFCHGEEEHEGSKVSAQLLQATAKQQIWEYSIQTISTSKSFRLAPLRWYLLPQTKGSPSGSLKAPISKELYQLLEDDLTLWFASVTCLVAVFWNDFISFVESSLYWSIFSLCFSSLAHKQEADCRIGHFVSLVLLSSMVCLWIFSEKVLWHPGVLAWFLTGSVQLLC